jgi:filamentous hemagglutinin family protein
MMKALLILFPLCLMANPDGASIISGQVHVERLDSQTTRIATSDKAIIEWQDFSINAGEKTIFCQPDHRSAVLNRVVGKNSSSILGSLEANGRVYLINPNGLLIGKQGAITAASFVGSTRSLSNEDFLNDESFLFKGDSQSRVLNEGTIHAIDGDIVLVGHEIHNEGRLDAPRGEVLIGAGQEIILTPSGDERLKIRLSNPLEKKTEIGIDLGGVVDALRVRLEADGNLYAMAINQTGIVQATRAVEKEGKIYLVAPQGAVQVNGTLEAREGGEVRVLGKAVSLLDHTIIDTSGDFGGGTVLIGGDKQGKNQNVLNSEITYVSEKASIHADALKQGDGGKVIVWSNESTSYFGFISVRGGDEGGNGGFVEVSGKHLDFHGTADRRASMGKAGMLLLDPFNVSITTNPGFNDQFTAGSPSTFQPTGSGANFNAADIVAALGSGDVTVLTTGFGGAQAGNVFVIASIVNPSPTALVLDTSDTPSGNINMSTDIRNTSNSSAGTISLRAAGNIIVDGNLDTQNFADISLSARGSINMAQTTSAQIDGLNVSAIAGVNLSAGASNGCVITAPAGQVTLVADNANPAAPNIGPGALNLGSQLTVTSDMGAGAGTLSIYSAKESQNTIHPAASFNGQTYTPPPADQIGVNTATNQWSTYYPSSFSSPAATPYTFFYKEPVASSSGPTNSQIANATNALMTSGNSSQSTLVTTGAPTQISIFQQPLNEPAVTVAISTYSSGFYIGPIQRPAAIPSVCP